MSDLPDSWTVSSFGELNEFTSGTVNPVRRAAETFDLYSVPSFPSGLPETLKGSAIGSTKQAVKPNDVLVCKINPRINRVWVVGKKEANEQIASSEWVGFRSQAVVPRYARHYFSSPRFRDLMESDVAGVGGSLTRAQPKKVMTYPVPVAPLAEQTRIANQLDILLARINACQRRLDNIPALIKRFRQAVLDRALSGYLTMAWREAATDEMDAWKATTLGDVADVGTGSTPLRSNGSFFANSGTPWVTSAATGSPYVTGAKEFVTPVAIASHRLKVYAPGTLLVAMYGEGKTRGQVAELRIHATINQACAAVTVDESQASAAFVKLALWSQYEQMRALAEGGNQPNLNLSKVKSIPIQLPPLLEQAEIVRLVEVLFSLADRIEARYKAAFTQAQRLTPLVLAKAFRGELLPQDPSDESASALLARIAAQRKSATPAPKTRQPRAPRVARAPKESATMTKSRQDADVKDKPYLAGHLRRLGEPVAAQVLFKVSELPVADFYKQLVWEVAQGHVKDNTTTLEPGHAAG